MLPQLSDRARARCTILPLHEPAFLRQAELLSAAGAYAILRVDHDSDVPSHVHRELHAIGYEVGASVGRLARECRWFAIVKADM